MHADVIVVGLGHAGAEAAAACSKMGLETIAIAMSLESVAQMSCNPSVGGPGKAHLVREIDALGGIMGVASDMSSIQMRMLNTSKGPAVQALRAQIDKHLYKRNIVSLLEKEKNLKLLQAMVESLIVDNGRVSGVVTDIGSIRSKVVIIATGTYLRGKVFIGDSCYDSGPDRYPASTSLSRSLIETGFALTRFKTGTPPRVDGNSIDYSATTIQPGDEVKHGFSFDSKVYNADIEQVPCYITWTNEKTHAIIRENLNRAPIYTGALSGTGPRYCPSIETKIVRFPDRQRHQVFIEPQCKDLREMYIAGISTSLPVDVQERFIRTIPGFQDVHVTRYGYAIEYDCIDPRDLWPTLESKAVGGLYFAGQINGTSGYEEAAAQGLLAAVNASLSLIPRKLSRKGEEPALTNSFTLSRSEAYIGVMIDDLTSKGIVEPYRMMTSRAEYRLLLRQDNADTRLMKLGHDLSLVSDHSWELFVRRSELVRKLINAKYDKNIRTLKENIDMDDFERSSLNEAIEKIELEEKYKGYIAKQERSIRHYESLEKKKIPEDINYSELKRLSREARESLEIVKPSSIGQASRITGVTPADIAALEIHLREMRKSKSI